MTLFHGSNIGFDKVSLDLAKDMYFKPSHRFLIHSAKALFGLALKEKSNV
jgi:hypothetical protein